MNHFAHSVRTILLVTSLVVTLAGCNRDAAQTSAPEPEPQTQASAETAPTTGPAYALATCVVSDHELGSMGDPVVMQVEGRDVKLCCEACIRALKADPKKYLAKLDAAAPSPTTRPAAH